MKNQELQLLRVSKNKRFLVKEDGTPFFWLGDTAWELFHRLNCEEAELYLKNRAERKFNVVQAVVLAGNDGVRTGNAYGRKPFLKNSRGEYSPILPDTEGNYSYWDHVDYIIDRAGLLGIYIALLPAWGDKINKAQGIGPVIFNSDNARSYGQWLGERYGNKKNIIWVMGGDRMLETSIHFDIINSMAEGIKESVGGRYLMTYHPSGGKSSSFQVHDEDWVDFNMIQSGHGKLNKDNYNMITADYNRLPIKPVLEAEPCYEDICIKFNPENGYFDEADVRKAAYWGVFSGGFGHTYGNHGICSMYSGVKECNSKQSPDGYHIINWKDALMRPGANQMQYLRALIEARPVLDRVPDQGLIAKNYKGANHLQATRGNDYAFIYNPSGLAIHTNMGKISGDMVKAVWYNPRNGNSIYIDTFKNEGNISFIPPSSGRGNDWVLILDNASRNYIIDIDFTS